MCIPSAGLHEPEQSRQVKGGSTLPLHVALVRGPWCWGPQPQGSSTRRSLVVSTGAAEPALERNKALLASPETETRKLVKYRTSWLWTEFIS